MNAFERRLLAALAVSFVLLFSAVILLHQAHSVHLRWAGPESLHAR